MDVKIKNMRWYAGRPVVIIGNDIAKKLNVHVNERILIKHKNKKSYAVVDIFPELVKKGEIGLSIEISSHFKVKDGTVVDVSISDSYIASSIIRKKLDGGELSQQDLDIIIKEINNNNLTEQEIAYFIAAEKLVGMSRDEVISLTRAMVSNGKRIQFDDYVVADKHCIGGIAGNRTTPIVVAICVAAGLKMPKSSSRAITSAAGTADVMETISNVEQSAESIKEIVDKVGGCLVWGGSLGLAPSDDKIIHVERTLNLDVEPQLLASILSKKIAAGSTHVLIDIPYGGGKMKNMKDAKKLGKKFKEISKYFGLEVEAVYTDGSQPIGNGYGPVLEMMDVISVLQNRSNCPTDLKQKSIYLSSELMKTCGIKDSKNKAKEILESGRAYEKFVEIVNAQNKSSDFKKRVDGLKFAKYSKDIFAKNDGEICKISNKGINLLCRILGAPETKTAGAYLYKHNGKVKKNDKIITLYSESKDRIDDAIDFLEINDPIKIK